MGAHFRTTQEKGAAALAARQVAWTASLRRGHWARRVSIRKTGQTAGPRWRAQGAESTRKGSCVGQCRSREGGGQREGLGAPGRLKQSRRACRQSPFPCFKLACLGRRRCVRRPHRPQLPGPSQSGRLHRLRCLRMASVAMASGVVPALPAASTSAAYTSSARPTCTTWAGGGSINESASIRGTSAGWWWYARALMWSRARGGGGMQQARAARFCIDMQTCRRADSSLHQPGLAWARAASVRAEQSNATRPGLAGQGAKGPTAGVQASPWAASRRLRGRCSWPGRCAQRQSRRAP